MRTHLVSISEAARQLGHDFRTIRKVADLAEVKVATNTGNLYDLSELRHLITVHKPHLLPRALK
jgi:hypothetical protein